MSDLSRAGRYLNNICSVIANVAALNRWTEETKSSVSGTFSLLHFTHMFSIVLILTSRISDHLCEKFHYCTYWCCWEFKQILNIAPRVLFPVSLPLLLTVPQPCQTIYQVLHDAVTRLIQYGVLYVAEVSLQMLTLTTSKKKKKCKNWFWELTCGEHLGKYC